MNSAKGGMMRAAIARMMADKEWNWRYGDLPMAEIESQATLRLRDEYARCQAWVAAAADAIGLPLPLGNGTNGPWHRQAVLDADGHFGVSDIAAGRILWTDAMAPSYVRRFAIAAKRTQSPHVAGGTGAVPTATSQVVVLLTSGPRVRIVRPQPVPTRVVWGLQTCYGDCGVPVTENDWRTEWKPFANLPQVEIDEPQWCKIDFGCGVQAEIFDNYRRSLNGAVTASGRHVSSFELKHHSGHTGYGDERLHYVYVLASRTERQEIVGYHQRHFRDYARHQAIRAAADVLMRNGFYASHNICGVIESLYDAGIVRMLGAATEKVNIATVCQEIRDGE